MRKRLIIRTHSAARPGLFAPDGTDRVAAVPLGAETIRIIRIEVQVVGSDGIVHIKGRSPVFALGPGAIANICEINVYSSIQWETFPFAF